LSPRRSSNEWADSRKWPTACATLLHPLDRSHRCRQVITLGSRDRLNSATTGATADGPARQGRLCRPDAAARGPASRAAPATASEVHGELPLTSPYRSVVSVNDCFHRHWSMTYIATVFSEPQGVVDDFAMVRMRL
jgi:hypothetical protein